MISAEPYLKTQRVAQALGVSVSTIKRWVDSGMIQAARTAGKHRLIPFSEALRLAREQGFSEANVMRLSDFGSVETPPAADSSVSLAHALLRDGKRSEVRKLIHSIYSAADAVTLADDVIRPLMERIGHGWMAGALDVFQEHEATEVVSLALRDLVDQDGAERNQGPLAIGATTESDPYVLPGLLGELVLLDLGWRVRNLGINLPLRSLAQAVARYQPRLIFISMSYIDNEERFIREYRSFHESAASTGAAVILGGQALGADLRSRLVFASFGDRMAHLAEFARRLRPVGDSSVTGDFSL